MCLIVCWYRQRSEFATSDDELVDDGDEEVDEDDEDLDEDDEDEDLDKSEHGEAVSANPYNPEDYAHLNVSTEISDLFNYISRFEPRDLELDTELAPFIPDYIPAVGDLDSFIHPPCPKPMSSSQSVPKQVLGLHVLAEPCAEQSDATVLELRLRALSKSGAGRGPQTVHSIAHADKEPKRIAAWINNIDAVHRQKPAPTVSYSRLMPDIDELIQLWPAEMEEVLASTGLLSDTRMRPMSSERDDHRGNREGISGNIDLSTSDLARTVCALLDIPVYSSLKESVHLLFTLYLEFVSMNSGNNGNTTPGAGNANHLSV